jgi:hypothetical protein
VLAVRDGHGGPGRGRGGAAIVWVVACPDGLTPGYDPWAEPGYAELAGDVLGLPGPAVECSMWRDGEGPCKHYATLLLAGGCAGEHMAEAPFCACCARLLAGACWLRCELCDQPVRVGAARPMYPELVG